METSVASPCIKICQIDPQSNLCTGCLRTLDEIATWSVMNDEEKRRTMAAVEWRRKNDANTEDTGQSW